ncbi:hypothetical protein pb186bvf_021169 [Paramecium bursaria]
MQNFQFIYQYKESESLFLSIILRLKNKFASTLSYQALSCFRDLVQTQKEGIQNGFKEQGILKEYKQYIQQWVNKPSVCFLDYIDKIIIMLKYLKYSRYLFCTSKTPPQAETRRYFTRSERLDDFQHTQSHLLDMMAKHFRKKIVERQLIDFKYIVGRPNTLFVPVSVEENFPNPSLNRGTVLRQHLDGVWIHCYNSTYPVHIQQEIHYIPNIKDQFITIDPDAETDFLEGADAESFKIKRDKEVKIPDDDTEEPQLFVTNFKKQNGLKKKHEEISQKANQKLKGEMTAIFEKDKDKKAEAKNVISYIVQIIFLYYQSSLGISMLLNNFIQLYGQIYSNLELKIIKFIIQEIQSEINFKMDTKNTPNENTKPKDFTNQKLQWKDHFLIQNQLEIIILKILDFLYFLGTHSNIMSIIQKDSIIIHENINELARAKFLFLYSRI